MNRFNQKIAKEIAQRQIDQTIDCVLGVTDPDYSLHDEIHVFEQNFEEDLQEKGINPTSSKIASITKHYEKMVSKAIKKLKSLQSK